jgi:RNA polymerase sigma factor (sigma-70 family)
MRKRPSAVTSYGGANWPSKSTRGVPVANVGALAQEAFLRAFTRLHQWRHDAMFSTWLYAVALNVFRSATRRGAVQELPLENADGAFVSSDPLEGLETRQLEALVRRMVRTLPRRYREAVILFYFLDQNVADAASVLGLPDGTFKAPPWPRAPQEPFVAAAGPRRRDSMTPSEIDRVLRTDEPIEPSAGFSSRVMSSVHAHAAADQKRRFAWRDVWPTAAIASVMIPLFIAMRLLEGGAPSGRGAEAGGWLLYTLTGMIGGWWWTRAIARK